jgi:hypothetical protein
MSSIVRYRADDFRAGNAPAGQLLSFACPKESNPRKGHPGSPALRAPLRCSPSRAAAQLAGACGSCSDSARRLPPAWLRYSAARRGPRRTNNLSIVPVFSLCTGAEILDGLVLGAPASRRVAQTVREKSEHCLSAWPRSGSRELRSARTGEQRRAVDQRETGEPGCPSFWCLFLGQARKRYCPVGALPTLNAFQTRAQRDNDPL